MLVSLNIGEVLNGKVKTSDVMVDKQDVEVDVYGRRHKVGLFYSYIKFWEFLYRYLQKHSSVVTQNWCKCIVVLFVDSCG